MLRAGLDALSLTIADEQVVTDGSRFYPVVTARRRGAEETASTMTAEQILLGPFLGRGGAAAPEYLAWRIERLEGTLATCGGAEVTTKYRMRDDLRVMRDALAAMLDTTTR